MFYNYFFGTLFELNNYQFYLLKFYVYYLYILGDLQQLEISTIFRDMFGKNPQGYKHAASLFESPAPQQNPLGIFNTESHKIKRETSKPAHKYKNKSPQQRVGQASPNKFEFSSGSSIFSMNKMGDSPNPFGSSNFGFKPKGQEQKQKIASNTFNKDGQIKSSNSSFGGISFQPNSVLKPQDSKSVQNNEFKQGLNKQTIPKYNYIKNDMQNAVTQKPNIFNNEKTLKKETGPEYIIKFAKYQQKQKQKPQIKFPNTLKTLQKQQIKQQSQQQKLRKQIERDLKEEGESTEQLQRLKMVSERNLLKQRKQKLGKQIKQYFFGNQQNEGNRTFTLENKNDLIYSQINREIQQLKRVKENKETQYKQQAQKYQNKYKQLLQKMKQHQKLKTQISDKIKQLSTNLQKISQKRKQRYTEDNYKKIQRQINSIYDQMYPHYSNIYDQIQYNTQKNKQIQQKIVNLKKQCQQLEQIRKKTQNMLKNAKNGHIQFCLKDYDQKYELPEYQRYKKQRIKLQEQYKILRNKCKQIKKDKQQEQKVFQSINISQIQPRSALSCIKQDF